MNTLLVIGAALGGMLLGAFALLMWFVYNWKDRW